MAVVSSERLPMTNTTPLTVEDYREKGMSEKDAIRQVEKNVFGIDSKRGRDGKPIEQGKGSAAQPTQQSIDAYKRYHNPNGPTPEADYETHLARMEKELADHNAKKAAAHGDDD